MTGKIIKAICGETKDIMYDEKIKKLNLELVKDEIGTPLIIFQDWTNERDAKDILTLHIKETIELKSIIDNLVLAYTEDMLEGD